MIFERKSDWFLLFINSNRKLFSRNIMMHTQIVKMIYE